MVCAKMIRYFEHHGKFVKGTRMGYAERFLYANHVCEISGKRIEPHSMELYRDDEGTVYVAKYVVQKIHMETVHVTSTSDHVHRIYIQSG
jgi:hypothetical protein